MSSVSRAHFHQPSSESQTTFAKIKGHPAKSHVFGQEIDFVDYEDDPDSTAKMTTRVMKKLRGNLTFGRLNKSTDGQNREEKIHCNC